MVGCIRVRIAGMLIAGLLPGVVWGVPAQKKPNPDRPTLPYSMLGPRRDDIDAYDSKAEPVARLNEALLRVDQTGWDLIHKYYPNLGTSREGPEKESALTITPSADSLPALPTKIPLSAPCHCCA